MFRFGVFGRFFSIVLPLSLLCFLSALWIYESKARNEAEFDLQRQLEFTLSNHAGILAEPIAKGFSEQIKLMATGLINRPEVDFLHVVDAEGNVLDSAGQPLNSTNSLSRTVSIRYTDEQGTRVVGELTAILNMNTFLEELTKRKNYALFLFMGLLISVLLASSLAYWQAVGIPLNRLMKAIQTFRAGGKHVSVPAAGNNQLGTVIEEYNDMQRAIEASHLSLVEHQKYLEQRTRDLQQELSNHAKTSKEVVYQARHDHLTGLTNRTAFSEIVKKSLDDAKQSNGQGALCFLDLDRFKLVNDTYGNQAGDAFLVSIANFMENFVRPQDQLSRLGGDQFGLLMPDTEPEQAMDLCRQLVDAIGSYRFAWKSNYLHAALSAGVAIIDQQSKDYEQLLKIADLGCYMAKKAGGGRLYFNADNSPEARLHSESLFWVQEVETAIEQDRLELWKQSIQPVGDSDKQTWVELLIRCRSTTGKVYAAGEFLPIAEHFGIVQNIDRWVVDTLVQTLLSEPESLPQKISANLSGQSISDDLFLEYLSSRIDSIKDQAHRICFEVTETAYISNFKNASQLMERIRAQGCSFALDDFGSGSASFEYLKNLQFDYLKIDGTYITNIANSSTDKEVVKAMKAIADTFSLKIIAECVEDQETLSIVESMGIQYVQGYFYGRPEPLIYKTS